MIEAVAREIVLVRAIETADRNRELLSEDDRRYASRSARELAQWQASEAGVAAGADQFLQQRAQQILRKVGERHPAFTAIVARGNRFRLASALLPPAALLLGAVADRISDPHRVDLLSAPLLLIIFWNLFVYLSLPFGRLLHMPRHGQAGAGLLDRFAGDATAVRGTMPALLKSAIIGFMREWAVLSRPLALARLARSVHLRAALFALGAMLSLYARGLLSQYVAGWESTFLDAGQLRAILSVLFAPARFVFQLPPFTVGDIEALRFASSPAVQPSQAGARWVHLYAATLLLLVVLPRLALAGLAHRRARRARRQFPLSLDQPYFRNLLQFMGGKAGVLRVLPYSFTVSERQDKGLALIAAMLLGEQARVMLRPSTAYGAEPAAAVLQPSDGAADTTPLTAVLFNLTATPEPQNHGAFLEQVVAGTAQPIAVLVDESAYLDRFGVQAGDAARRLQRIALWEDFCRFHKTTATIVNLADPQARPVDLGAGPRLSDAA